MMEKKAILLPNVVSVIIAVLGILILVYGAYKVYTIVAENEEQKNAQAFIDIIK